MTTTNAQLSLPDRASFLTRMRTAYRAIRILDGEPGDPIAGPVFNACIEQTPFRRLAERLRESEEGQELLAERPSLNSHEIDIEALSKLPEGTLGHSTARYYLEGGITPFDTTFEVKNDVDYLSKRYRETHDLFHVVTGYGIDVVGEMELQAFAMGNLGLRGPIMIIGYSSLSILTGAQSAMMTVKKVRWGDYFSVVREAYRAGKASAPLITFPFREHWDTPVTQLRAKLCPNVNPRGDAGVALAYA